MVQHSSLLGTVVLVTAAAAVTDARSGRIPNALTLPLVVLAPLAHWAYLGSGGLVSSLAGAGVSVALPLVLFARRAMGGGDVKLFCGLGAALGPSLGLEVQLAAYIVAGAYALGILVRGGHLGDVLRRLLKCGSTPPGGRARPETVRLGIPVFLAALLCVVPRFLGG